METSDSEYFESADEGSQSEDDTVYSTELSPLSSKTKENIASDVSCKPDKLQLEILSSEKSNSDRISDQTINVYDSFQDSNFTKEITLEKLNNNCQHKQYKDIKDESTKVQICESKIDTNTAKISRSSKNIPSKDLLSSKELIPNKELISSKEVKSSEDLISSKDLSSKDLISDENLISTKDSCKQIITLEKSLGNQVHKSDENLWDDNEINWEPKPEEPKEIQNNKNEFNTNIAQKSNTDQEYQKNVKDSGDNLWGDDEIDWETEGHLEQAQQESPATQNKEEDNSWQNDDWEPIEKPNEILESKPEAQASSGWGGWNSWGVTSLLNTATQGVSTFTTHVSQGFSTVIENGMGIPDAEQMAKDDTQLENKVTESKVEEPNTPQLFGLGNLVGSVSQITKFVESTGTKVISGGLDTLETIGKKTMEVLQEGDPGLKKKRAFLKLDNGKPVLSQVLREAKEKGEKEDIDDKKEQIFKRKVKSYETLFDDYQGLVHLEALEMISRLSNMKLQSFNDSYSGEALKELQETMDQVKELCELPEEEDDQQLSLAEFKEKIDIAVKDLNIPVSYEKLLNTCDETDNWINNINYNHINEEDLHQQAIESLAQTTALSVEQFHKIGELLLVKEHRSTADEADSLVQLTAIVKSLILRQASKFTDKLSSIENSDKNKSSELITNIFYEAANSSSYIEDAFQLLIPVLQVGAV